MIVGKLKDSRILRGRDSTDVAVRLELAEHVSPEEWAEHKHVLRELLEDGCEVFLTVRKENVISLEDADSTVSPAVIPGVVSVDSSEGRMSDTDSDG